MGLIGSRLGGSCAANDPAAHTPGSVPAGAPPQDARAQTKPPVTSSRRESERRTLRQNLVHERKHTAVWDNYEIIKEIGHGMTGKVYQVVHKGTGEKYALKCMEMRRIDPELLDDLRNEIELLKMMDHPNVIKLYEYYEDENNIYLILEMCDGGELFDRLHQQKGNRYSEAEAARLMFKMCAAIGYCHYMGVSHRDLKLENFIFESKEESSNVKLIDFGLSSKYGSSLRRMHTMVGTPYYIAPEVLNQSETGNRGYTMACDTWSLGVIAYMLLSGTPPFKGRRDREVLQAVRRGKYTLSGPKWDAISEEAKDFIRHLLVYNPAKRMTAEQALKHLWLQKAKHAEEATPLDPEVLTSLRDFAKFSAFKRAALEAIAFSMSAQSISHLREQFSHLDKDNTGFVSLQEFLDVLQRAGTSREEATTIFNGIDQDHTNHISYTEFLAATINRRLWLSRERIRDAFQRLDVDGTGFITRENLKALLGDEWTPAKVDVMMREADSKGDGRIDFEEFLAVMTKETKDLWRDVSGGISSPVDGGGMQHSSSTASGIVALDRLSDGGLGGALLEGGSTDSTPHSMLLAPHQQQSQFPPQPFLAVSPYNTVPASSSAPAVTGGSLSRFTRARQDVHSGNSGTGIALSTNGNAAAVGGASPAGTDQKPPLQPQAMRPGRASNSGSLLTLPAFAVVPPLASPTAASATAASSTPSAAPSAAPVGSARQGGATAQSQPSSASTAVAANRQGGNTSFHNSPSGATSPIAAAAAAAASAVASSPVASSSSGGPTAPSSATAGSAGRHSRGVSATPSLPSPHAGAATPSGSTGSSATGGAGSSKASNISSATAAASNGNDSRMRHERASLLGAAAAELHHGADDGEAEMLHAGQPAHTFAALRDDFAPFAGEEARRGPGGGGGAAQALRDSPPDTTTIASDVTSRQVQPSPASARHGATSSPTSASSSPIKDGGSSLRYRAESGGQGGNVLSSSGGALPGVLVRQRGSSNYNAPSGGAPAALSARAPPSASSSVGGSPTSSSARPVSLPAGGGSGGSGSAVMALWPPSAAPATPSSASSSSSSSSSSMPAGGETGGSVRRSSGGGSVGRSSGAVPGLWGPSAASSSAAAALRGHDPPPPAVSAPPANHTQQQQQHYDSSFPQRSDSQSADAPLLVLLRPEAAAAAAAGTTGRAATSKSQDAKY